MDSFIKEDGEQIISVSTGFPLKNIEVKIFSDSYEELSQKKLGEIFIKSPSMTEGYYNDVMSTSALFEGDWLKTGDLGYISEGELYVVGRKKEVMKINGKSYFPSDLESEVSQLSNKYAMGRIAAVSLLQTSRDGGKQEVPHIFVESKKFLFLNKSLFKKDILNKISKFLILNESQIHLVSACSLPRTSSGKTQRFKIQEMMNNQEFKKIENNLILYSVKARFKKINLFRDYFKQKLMQFMVLLKIKKVGNLLQKILNFNINRFAFRNNENNNLLLQKEIEKRLILEVINLNKSLAPTINNQLEISALGIDSIQLVELNQKINEIWKVDINLIQFIQFKTLKDVQEFIYNRLSYNVEKREI